MASTDVTVVVVPRERFSATERSLTNLYQQTTLPFTLVYVSAGAPPDVQRYLEREAVQRGFRLITTDGYLTPNQARNLALAEASTKYVVVLDNDALVMSGWLERLVACAEETGAWIVGPLSLEGEPEEGIIHSSGGTLHFRQENGHRIVYHDQGLLDVPLASVTEPLERRTCDFVEFHCMLIRTDMLGRIMPLDEQLFSQFEHIDIGMVAREAGGTVYVEPSAVVTYVPPPPFAWSDLPYFMLRWSDEWGTASVARFVKKWDVAAARYIGDAKDEAANLEAVDSVILFGRAHRRLSTGVEIPSTWDGDLESALAQARLMVALFQSVDRDGFDLALTTPDDTEVETSVGLTPAAVHAQLPAMMARAYNERLNLLIRPRPPRRSSDPMLIRADVSEDTLSSVEPYGFLTLKSGPDRYQVWLAVDRRNWRSAAIARRLERASVGASELSHFSRMAGSLVLDEDSLHAGSDRATLRRGVTGFVTTGMDLERDGAVEQLWASRLY